MANASKLAFIAAKETGKKKGCLTGKIRATDFDLMDPESFEGLRLPGGFSVAAVEFVSGPLSDAIDRPALAKSIISGKKIHISLLTSLSDEEKSVTILPRNS